MYIKRDGYFFLLQFRSSDYFDKFLMLSGTIAAIISAAMQPLMFLFYGYVAGAFVDYGRFQIMSYNYTNSTQLLNSTQKW